MADVAATRSLAVTLQPMGDIPRQSLNKLATFGVGFVQLASNQPGLRPRDLDSSARRGLLAACNRLELGISGIDTFIPPEHFLDPTHLDRAMTAVLDAIRLAADLGRCPLSLELPITPDEAFDDAFAEVLNEAERHGIELADHAVPLALRDNVGIGIDPAAYLAEHADPAGAVMIDAPRLVSARLCDLWTTGVRGPLGDAVHCRLDVESYKIALAGAGYNRAIVIDARGWRHPWPDVKKTIDTWTQLGVMM